MVVDTRRWITDAVRSFDPEPRGKNPEPRRKTHEAKLQRQKARGKGRRASGDGPSPLGGETGRVGHGRRHGQTERPLAERAERKAHGGGRSFFFFSFTLVTGTRRSLSLKLSDTRVYAPQKRTRCKKQQEATGKTQEPHTPRPDPRGKKQEAQGKGVPIIHPRRVCGGLGFRV